MDFGNRLLYFIVIGVLVAVIIVLKVVSNLNKKKKSGGKKKIPVFKGPDPVIGNYKKVAQIGTGGMSTIYWAKTTHGDKDVVLKVLENVKRENEQAGKEFLEEGKIINKIHQFDPSAPVVKIIEYSQDKSTGLYYIAMEYLNGKSLETILDSKSQLNINGKLLIINDVARALKICHSMSICHCDIAPGNIIVHQNKRNATLIDFSIASSPSQAITSGLGNPYYMSPEQGKRGGIITAKSDIYSLGAVLFHMVEGIFPHKAGKCNTIMELHKSGSTPQITKSVLPALKEYIYKMMSLNPVQRPNITDVVDTLGRFIQQVQ